MPKGVVVSFQEDRGFGFIRTPESDALIFLHVAEIPGRATPAVGQSVEFAIEPAEKGPRAVKVRLGSRQWSPFAYYGLWMLGISAVLASGAVHWLGLGWFWAYLLSINLTVFAFYGVDKWKAGRGAFRIPENVLHAGALVGGSPGAYAAMRVFRHKTIKGRFRLIFWIMVALQGALLVYLPLRWMGVL